MEIILSSSKRGYGLKELLNSEGDEYWSSDDVLPHAISIFFPVKTYVYCLSLYFSYILDESYTPEQILVCFNSTSKLYKFQEPEGIKEFKIETEVFEMQIIIISNHTDGRDSHLRQLKIMKSPTEKINMFKYL